MKKIKHIENIYNFLSVIHLIKAWETLVRYALRRFDRWADWDAEKRNAQAAALRAYPGIRHVQISPSDLPADEVADR